MCPTNVFDKTVDAKMYKNQDYFKNIFQAILFWAILFLRQLAVRFLEYR